MRTMMLSVASAVTLLSLFAGCCSQTGQVARGQGPAPAPPPVDGAPISGAYDGDVQCEDGQAGDECYAGACQKCLVPYHVPHDFVFPTAGPPAVVQYPYYTCKGPDCFFLQP